MRSSRATKSEFELQQVFDPEVLSNLTQQEKQALSRLYHELSALEFPKMPP